jgi:hypothetical protein
MRSLLRMFASSGVWRASPFAQLPEVPRYAAEITRQQVVLAGGLALILSRTTASQRAASFPKTARLYESLEHDLGTDGRSMPDAELLSETLHETHDLADPCTKAALRFCLDAAVRQSARHPASEPAELRLSSRHGAEPEACDPNAPTVVSKDVFGARSKALRKSVAGARGSGGA